jgi:predicted transcriptional regulator
VLDARTEKYQRFLQHPRTVAEMSAAFGQTAAGTAATIRRLIKRGLVKVAQAHVRVGGISGTKAARYVWVKS